MPSLNLFPTVVHRANARGTASLRTLTKDLLEESYQHRALDRVGEKWSRDHYDAGYTSYSSVTDLPHRSEQFRRLRDWIDREVKRYARTLELDLGDGRLEMTSCWVNMMGKGCTHAFHLHPLSTVSGTFYLQVPPRSGTLKLEDPRIAAYMASPPRRANASTANRRYVEIAPKAGDLILFESWLKHEVTPNRARDERVSISFNYDWIR